MLENVILKSLAFVLFGIKQMFYAIGGGDFGTLFFAQD
jgi:hypothetical protein